MKLITASNTKSGTVRLYLNDIDVTDVCFYAETPDGPYVNGEGKMKLFVKNKADVVIKVEEKTGLTRWEPIP
jgi:hypothetical protein